MHSFSALEARLVSTLLKALLLLQKLRHAAYFQELRNKLQENELVILQKIIYL